MSNENGIDIVAKYSREELDALVGKSISYSYKNSPCIGKIIKTDFNKNFKMAYGLVTIQEPEITFIVGIEKIDIPELNNGL